MNGAGVGAVRTGVVGQIMAKHRANPRTTPLVVTILNKPLKGLLYG